MFGLAPGCLGPCVYAPAGLLAPMPPHLSFAAAATTPTVYTTVFAAFQQSHSLGPHTRVLVHAGTGGVGLAAVQVASVLGCRVLATAGSPAKRAALRCVGVAGTADSRSTAFAYTAAIVGAAGGGIDLLLNSLTSPGGCEVVVGACGCVDPAHGASSVPLKHSSLLATHNAGMVAASLAGLSLGGRFAEIGKRDIWSAARIAQGGLQVAE